MSSESHRSELACFAVSAAAEPGTLSRLLEPFAKRGLVPCSVHARVTDGWLRADIQVEMDPELARIVVESLRQSVSVERVLLASLDTAIPARSVR
jgi:acetolactate synthase small subunit